MREITTGKRKKFGIISEFSKLIAKKMGRASYTLIKKAALVCNLKESLFKPQPPVVITL